MFSPSLLPLFHRIHRRRLELLIPNHFLALTFVDEARSFSRKAAQGLGGLDARAAALPPAETGRGT